MMARCPLVCPPACSTLQRSGRSDTTWRLIATRTDLRLRRSL